MAGQFRVNRVAKVSAWIAHLLAWAVGILLAFWPAYSGESVTPAAHNGEVEAEVTRATATLVEANGIYVLFLLLVPILLTGSALLAILFAHKRRFIRGALLWAPVILLLGFCLLAIFSIGILYLPTALALLVAAVSDMSYEGTGGVGEQ